MRVTEGTSVEAWYRLSESLAAHPVLAGLGKKPAVWIAPSALSALNEVLSALAWRTWISGSEAKTVTFLSKVDPDLDRLAKKAGEVGLSSKAMDLAQWKSAEPRSSAFDARAAVFWTEVDFATGELIPVPGEIEASLQSKTDREVKVRLEHFSWRKSLWMTPLAAYEVRVVGFSGRSGSCALVLLGDRLRSFVARNLPFAWSHESLEEAGRTLLSQMQGLADHWIDSGKASHMEDFAACAELMRVELLKLQSVNSVTLGGSSGDAGLWIHLKDRNGQEFSEALRKANPSLLQANQLLSLSQLAHSDPWMADWLLSTKRVDTDLISGCCWLSPDFVAFAARSSGRALNLFSV